MQELNMMEVEEVSGAIGVAVAGAAIALAAAGVTSLYAGMAAGYSMIAEYMKSQKCQP